jgi:Protein of unknown function (DUF1759)
MSDILKLKKALKGLLTNAENRLAPLTVEQKSSQEIQTLFKTNIERYNARLEELIIETAQDDKLRIEYSEEIEDLARRLDKLVFELGTENAQHPGGKEEAAFAQPKLKPIELPIYEGKHSKWKSFWDTFNSTIHKSEHMPDTTKMRYLISCLRDSALIEVQHLPITKENYAVAVGILEENHNKPSLAVAELFKDILDIPMPIRSNKTALRDAVNRIRSTMGALGSCPKHLTNMESLVAYIISSRLDRNLREQHFKGTSQDELLSLHTMVSFLSRRTDYYEATDQDTTMEIGKPMQTDQTKHAPIQNAANRTKSGQETSCPLCNEPHPLRLCKKFRSATPQERMIHVEEKRLCKNCFGKNHVLENCFSKGTCLLCEERHNTLLHASFARGTTLLTTGNTCTLPVIEVYGQGRSKYERLLVLPDLGSQETLITNKAVERLSISEEVMQSKEPDILRGLGNTILTKTQGLVEIKLIPLETTLQVTITVVAKIVDSISKITDCNGSSHEIDLLLSAADTMIMMTEQKDRSISHVQTRFGKIETRTQPNVTVSTVGLVTNQDELERHFEQMTTRDQEGRVVVQLPFKRPPEDISSTRYLARKRFAWLEARFRREPKFEASYREFMRQYISSGHMIEIEKENEGKKPHVFFPHHAVWKPHDAGKKIRVVFDASAKPNLGVSFNDAAFVGPTVQSIS